MTFTNFILPQAFYVQPALIVARELLGKELVHQIGNKQVTGIIVETEAYLGLNDPASHSFSGLTKRNTALFSCAGTIYIYHIYGIHFCFNVVTGKKGIGEAVLIRAIQPEEGIAFMKRQRDTITVRHLTNGPAKLVQAFQITMNDNQKMITSPPLFVRTPSIVKRTQSIKSASRIGIRLAAEKPYRFYIAGNPYLSR